MDDQNYSAPQRVQPVQTTPSAPTQSLPPKRRGKYKLTFLLGLLLVVALAFGAAYYWQDSQKKDIQTKLDSTTNELNVLKQQGTTSDRAVKADDTPANISTLPASNVTTDLIPGNTDTARTDGRILVEVIYKITLQPSAVWVEYGTHPDKINKATTKITTDLGTGEPDEDYARGRTIAISNTDLQPGTTYYYRVAATVKNQTQYSAIASFVTAK